MRASPPAIVIHADRRCHGEALAGFLGTCPDFTVIGYETEWVGVERLCALHVSDTVLVDVGFPSHTTVGQLRRLRQRCPAVRVILTYEELPCDVAAALGEMGVSAVPYQQGLDALLKTLSGVASPAPTGSDSGLTPRQLQVLALISAGHSVNDIARRLGISARTVENHKRHIYTKLQVTSRGGAASRAASLGILDSVAPEEPPASGFETVSDGRPRARLSRTPKLTGRERDILHSVARGESVRQTARSLGVAVKTVENLQSLLYRKLGVRNRVEALAKASALGLVHPIRGATGR